MQRRGVQFCQVIPFLFQTKKSDVLEARRSNFIPPLRSIRFATECKADKLLKNILNWNMVFQIFVCFGETHGK